MKKLKQVLKILALLVICVFGIYLFYPFVAYDLIFSSKAKSILEDHQIEERIKEVRSDYFIFGENDWIAIVYKDYHRDALPTGRSLAFAKSSNGLLLRSDQHYCVNIRKTVSIGERMEEADERLAEDEFYGPILIFSNASTIEEAVEALKGLGFYET